MEEIKNADTVITYTDYKSYKRELDTELEKSAESFIRIGYLLKVARDTGILAQSDYENVNDFAQKEYGLDKTQVSRFIRINDRFSKDGYSETLKDEYRGFGYAKLAIMLQLPDSINEELTEEYSKSDIQSIKEEVDAEKKITDIEVMLEEKDEVQQSMDDILLQTVYQIGKDDCELYLELWESVIGRQEEEKDFMEHLAPPSTKTYSVRIPGTGRTMLIIKEEEEEVKIISIRNPSDKKTYKKSELINAFRNIFRDGNAKASWESVYGEEFPQKEEVAPVQPDQKKASKVVKAKTEEKTEEKTQAVQQEAQKTHQTTLHDFEEGIPEPVQEQHDEVPEKKEEMQDAAVADEEEQIAGQSNISDYPEYMPEKKENKAEEQSENKADLQKRAYNLITMTLSASMCTWKEKEMPLEIIQRNKQYAKELLETFEEMEKKTSRQMCRENDIMH